MDFTRSTQDACKAVSRARSLHPGRHHGNHEAPQPFGVRAKCRCSWTVGHSWKASGHDVTECVGNRDYLPQQDERSRRSHTRGRHSCRCHRPAWICNQGHGEAGAVLIDVGINRVTDEAEVASFFGDDPARAATFANVARSSSATSTRKPSQSPAPTPRFPEAWVLSP